MLVMVLNDRGQEESDKKLSVRIETTIYPRLMCTA